MERKNYNITFEGQTVVKHAWNSACRTVEKLVKERAIAEKQTYRLTGKQSVKEGFDHVSGSREWTADNGKTIVFNIAKAA